MKDNLLVNEIFGSIDGEGIRTGELATFIRLTGCNLRCRYCDTIYSFNEGTLMSIEDILVKVKEIGYKNITLTGGEPLLQKNSIKLINKLIEEGFNVNIETNGAMDITEVLNKDVIITLDYKTLSSNMNNQMILSNLEKLRENDVLKFVCNKNDLEDIKKVLGKYNIKSYIYLSPIYKEIEPKELVEFLKLLHIEHFNVDKIRIQVQLHKIIWNPDMRGV